MSNNVGKFALGLVSLVVLWVGVYWWWEPSEPPISFGATPPGDRGPILEDDPESHVGLQPLPMEPGPVIQQVSQAPPQPNPRPVVAVHPPQFQDYTVRQGDTLRTISIKFFGNASRAAAIARANPLMDPARLRSGRLIRIPRDPDNIQGRPVRPVPGAQARAPAAGVPKSPSQRTYTVRPGDTLSAIAQDVYGTSAKAESIFDANRDKMKDRDELKVGMVLTIPAQASGPSN